MRFQKSFFILLVICVSMTCLAQEKIDVSKSGKYKSGEWEYVIYVDEGKNPTTSGKLLKDGKELAAPEDKSITRETPWGKVVWKPRLSSHGRYGWLPEPLPAEKMDLPQRQEEMAELVAELRDIRSLLADTPHKIAVPAKPALSARMDWIDARLAELRRAAKG